MINRSKVGSLFITHALPKNLLVDEVVRIGVLAVEWAMKKRNFIHGRAMLQFIIHGQQRQGIGLDSLPVAPCRLREIFNVFPVFPGAPYQVFVSVQH